MKITEAYKMMLNEGKTIRDKWGDLFRWENGLQWKSCKGWINYDSLLDTSVEPFSIFDENETELKIVIGGFYCPIGSEEDEEIEIISADLVEDLIVDNYGGEYGFEQFKDTHEWVTVME